MENSGAFEVNKAEVAALRLIAKTSSDSSAGTKATTQLSATAEMRPIATLLRCLLGWFLLSSALLPVLAADTKTARADPDFATLAVETQDAASVEYKIKAAYMLNFAKFVDWPREAFPAGDTPVTVCVLGKDPFGSDLEKAIGDKSIQGRPLCIKRIGANKPVEHCHLLFISSSERRRLPQILRSLTNACVLTIGDTEQFTRSGGMIQFTEQENTLRFHINAEAAEKAGLKISSKLLQIGQPQRERLERAPK